MRALCLHTGSSTTSHFHQVQGKGISALMVTWLDGRGDVPADGGSGLGGQRVRARPREARAAVVVRQHLRNAMRHLGCIPRIKRSQTSASNVCGVAWTECGLVARTLQGRPSLWARHVNLCCSRTSFNPVR